MPLQLYKLTADHAICTGPQIMYMYMHSVKETQIHGAAGS